DKCAHTVELLKVPERWLLFKDDPAYYEDAWNGKMHPAPEDSIGSVFNDSYVMPQLLNAIANYLLLINVFTPNDIAHHRADLGKFRDFLRTQHDKSKGGIRTMSYVEPLPPSGDERLWSGELIFNIRTGWDFGLGASAYHDDGVVYFQPFGAA